MTTQDATLEREWHRKFAVTLFNLFGELKAVSDLVASRMGATSRA